MPEPVAEAPVHPIVDLEHVRYEGGPAMLLFGNDAAWRHRLTMLISDVGGRVSIAAPLDEASRRIVEHAAPDGVIADIIGAEDGLAERILDLMEQGAAAGRFRSVVLISRDQIDLAAARISQGDVAFLCEHDPADLAYVISGLLAPYHIQLNDISTDAAPMRLRELSEEVSRIAKTLASLSNTHAMEGLLLRGNGHDGAADDPVIDAPVIRAMIRARRMRAQFFHADLFADPAWDMLLDLSAARLEGQAIPVSSLCIAAAVPATTGLRYIAKMTEAGLLTRIADPHDRRRAFVALSKNTAEAMVHCLTAMLRVTRGAS